ncbi:hypothetical protein [uncultured Nocardioides sp.]|uniref:DUF6966 domain-containing protein n=1 Tax=uncultured Nocardioides sp. TaxID=198441 RepID=UPI00261BED3E|nr:hypothetical protein [uncultured Nocardioides sp.]
MDEREADERYARLLTALVDARDLLERAGEARWAQWLARVETEVRAHDAHGLRRLRGAFGGTGSLNDLVLTPVNGHTVAPDEVHAVNRTLMGLLDAAYGDASALLRDLR